MKFKRSNDLQQYIKHDPDLRAVLLHKANVGLAFAQARARRRTGTQAESGHVELVERGGVKGDRMEAQIVFDAPYSAAREFGNKRTRAEGNLRAAIPVIERS